ncbi:MAG: YifB family Mg chelatase-like AAA ATPase [Actinomycetota bacterium]|nr:YifB family Mg chelatase-like AAA ATPase [Actinomycetota bacterium]
MNLARAESVAVIGLEGHPVDVEVSLAQGLPAFNIVGLPDVSVQEARERVRAAIVHSKEDWPQKRITVNLSPAHLRKAGSGFDLAIAVGIVAAGGRSSEEKLKPTCFVGELSLDGTVRRVRGVLAAAMAARRNRKSMLIVPRANAQEAALVEGIAVLPVDHLTDAIKFIRNETIIEPWTKRAEARDAPPCDLDLTDVRGQGPAAKALEIAAAGGHNLLMMGTPGGGKTMLARRLPTILPPLSNDEALEVTRIYSVAGLLDEGEGLVRTRPFRAPHHSVSTTGLVGGGSGLPQPGEVSLAHRGALFLDEATEFRRDALEALRGPIEDGAVTIVRSKFSVTYPARFQLIAAANPCPCGHAGDEVRPCICLPGRIANYKGRLSGPLMDRIDLQVDVPRLRRGEIFRSPEGESSAIVRERVLQVRNIQRMRLKRFGLSCNAEITAGLLAQTCGRTASASRTLEKMIEKYRLSGRGAHRLLRVSRTIADLHGDEVIDEEHVSLAAGYRVGAW